MDPLTQSLAGALGGAAGIVIVAGVVVLMLAGPLLALSVVWNIYQIRKQLQRLNNTLETR